MPSRKRGIDAVKAFGAIEDDDLVIEFMALVKSVSERQ